MSEIEIRFNPAGTAILTLNRPEVRNALNPRAMLSFAAAVEELVSSPAPPRALIITGASGSFCAGGDLHELHALKSEAEGLDLSRKMSAALNTLRRSGFPSIAAIDGPAVGGGAEIALACDLRLMGSSSILRFPQLSLAVTTAWGGTRRLAQLVGESRALDLLLSARLIAAEEALAIGLVNAVHPQGAVLAAAQDYAAAIQALDPSAVGGSLQLLRAAAPPLSEAERQLEESLFAKLWAAPAHQLAAEQARKRLMR